MLAAVVLVVSTALRVVGPALIAYGINTALPAVVDEMDWMPTIGVVVVYLLTAHRRRRRSSAGTSSSRRA